MSSHVEGKASTRALTLGALGVAYGDIGTSPLYALSEAFHSAHATGGDLHDVVLGVLSLVVWTLLIVVTLKYLAFVLRADNEGEGGILALLALVLPRSARDAGWSFRPMLVAGLVGAALLYGDGVITPAISVISAVEGLKLIAPSTEPYVIPVTIAILVGLFSLQSVGTGRVGAVFGPIMVVWFTTLTVLGLINIVDNPGVLAAVWPGYALAFLQSHGLAALPVLGGVFLVSTGGESLYADLGHFGKTPIRYAWFGLVLPALTINYFGQGALLLSHPDAHPFFGLAPRWALIPLVLLTTAATVIASQALISGAFSLTRQAVQLGYMPRLRVEHTSASEIGQIYVPSVNFALFVACVAIVVAFGSSTALAAAYGIAVVATMLMTTALFSVFARKKLLWPLPVVIGVTALFGFIELGFLAANAEKIPHGGWFPLVLGAFLFTMMLTWYDGRILLAGHLREKSLPYDALYKRISEEGPYRAMRTAVYMTGDAERIPPSLFRNLVHNKVVHERVIMVTVDHDAVPHVPRPSQIQAVEKLEHGFWRVRLHFGFMDDPNVPRALAGIKGHGLPWDLDDCTFFLGRETVLPTRLPGMALWREHVFAYLVNNAQRATAYYGLPPSLVVEFGTQVEI